jgi:hypothetical protein
MDVDDRRGHSLIVSWASAQANVRGGISPIWLYPEITDMLTWFNTIVGMILSFALGMGILGLTPFEVGNCILASEVAGLIALLGTLQAERRPWIRRYVLNRSLKTWALFLTLYFGPMLLIAPPLRDGKTLLILWLPLALGNGLAIKVFGPIQDWIYRREQIQARQRAAL